MVCKECGGRIILTSSDYVCESCGLITDELYFFPSVSITQTESLKYVKREVFQRYMKLFQMYGVKYLYIQDLKDIIHHYNLDKRFLREVFFLFKKALRLDEEYKEGYFKKELVLTCGWIALNIVLPIHNFKEYLEMLNIYGHRFSYKSYRTTLINFPILKQYIINRHSLDFKINTLFNIYFVKIEGFEDFREAYISKYGGYLRWNLYLKVLRQKIKVYKEYLIKILRYRSFKIINSVIATILFIMEEIQNEYNLTRILTRNEFCLYFNVSYSSISDSYYTIRPLLLRKGK